MKSKHIAIAVVATLAASVISASARSDDSRAFDLQWKSMTQTDKGDQRRTDGGVGAKPPELEPQTDKGDVRRVRDSFIPEWVLSLLRW